MEVSWLGGARCGSVVLGGARWSYFMWGYVVLCEVTWC